MNVIIVAMQVIPYLLIYKLTLSNYILPLFKYILDLLKKKDLYLDTFICISTFILHFNNSVRLGN